MHIRILYVFESLRLRYLLAVRVRRKHNGVLSGLQDIIRLIPSTTKTESGSPGEATEPNCLRQSIIHTAYLTDNLSSCHGVGGGPCRCNDGSLRRPTRACPRVSAFNGLLAALKHPVRGNRSCLRACRRAGRHPDLLVLSLIAASAFGTCVSPDLLPAGEEGRLSRSISPVGDPFFRGRACRSAPAARGAADHVYHLIRRHWVCSCVGWPRQLPLRAFECVPGLRLSIRRSCSAVPQGRVSQGCPVAICSDGGPPTSVAASPGSRVRNRDDGVSCLCPHRRHRLILASTGTVRIPKDRPRDLLSIRLLRV